MPYTSIREIADEIHSGLITPTELVLETLERIDAQEGEIHAFVTVMRCKMRIRRSVSCGLVSIAVRCMVSRLRSKI